MNPNLTKRENPVAEQSAHPERKARSLEELGVRESVLEEIALKILYLHGPFSILDLSDLGRISYDAAEQLFNRLRAKLLCEVTGMTGTIQEIAISSTGRIRPWNARSARRCERRSLPASGRPCAVQNRHGQPA
jgi:hypothetical protein